MDNYTVTIDIKTTADKVYNALTREIPLWWTEMFDGSSLHPNEIFTIKFGDDIYKTMQVKELIPNSKTSWYVEDSLIAFPTLKNQKEWTGTTIVWDIEQKEQGVLLHLTHFGLHPAIECYEVCSGGWIQFTQSLKLFLETGKGNPYTQ
ncbi:SRPBCC domain-containing protein [Chryseobacterium sp. G0186]|uniref:SRPBCC family protein n=1 Tax=Chryseobacterium sp. G0186 TaxID=2487064 RepID=UPI000F4EF58E|nr:SRPBCC domain-containing protein [Chryseobacterium sp. G0186]AZA79985.1 SRPBCC domain-containing protein [Chryseobacterium sp. G0186]